MAFHEEVFSIYNQIRQKPKDFIKQIEDLIQYITRTDKGMIFEYEKSKVAIKSGEIGFRNAIEILSSLDPITPLEYAEDLNIELPDDEAKWMNTEFIKEVAEKKKQQLGTKYGRYFGFHPDYTTLPPLICTLLQFVDDSGLQGQRRDNIINPYFRYCAVTSKSVVPKGKKKAKIGIYSVFA